jgi:hypothetical protein
MMCERDDNTCMFVRSAADIITTSGARNSYLDHKYEFCLLLFAHSCLFTCLLSAPGEKTYFKGMLVENKAGTAPARGGSGQLHRSSSDSSVSHKDAPQPQPSRLRKL